MGTATTSQGGDTGAAATSGLGGALAPVGPSDQGASGGTSGVTSDGATTTIHGAAVNIEAASTRTPGVIQASTVIADSVVASSYTPGAGNVW
jgi:hypothetical protein